MRQLAGTIVLFALISCAAAIDAKNDATSAPEATTMAEVTVEGTPEAVELDVPLAELCDEGATCAEDGEALKSTKVSLAAPWLEVRALSVRSDGEKDGGTLLAVRTAEGWRKVADTFLAYSDDDPGCPSIERESAIEEIRVENGALVVVTTSDREWLGEDDRFGPLVTSKARACREVDGEIACGEAAVVSAKLSLRSYDDQDAAPVERSFTTKYWVDADGEIEAERPYDDAATWNDERS